jgi:hypothetical protein
MRLATTWITLARKNEEFAVRHRLSRRRKVNHGMALGSADLDCTGYGFSGVGEQPASDKNRKPLASASRGSTSRTDVFMAESLDRWVWAKLQRRLCVEKGRLAFPDHLREYEIVPEYLTAQAGRFADVAVWSFRRKSRSVQDGRMSLQAASFVYGRDAPACLRVFQLPHIGCWRRHGHECRALAVRVAHLLKSALLRPHADAKQRRLRGHRSRSDTLS